MTRPLLAGDAGLAGLTGVFWPVPPTSFPPKRGALFGGGAGGKPAKPVHPATNATASPGTVPKPPAASGRVATLSQIDPPTSLHRAAALHVRAEPYDLSEAG